MKRNNTLVWLIPLVILLLLIPFVVPSSLSVAGAEAADRDWDPAELPVYAPVELENPAPAPIPLDQPTLYAPHADAFLPDEAGYVDSTISVRVESHTYGKTNVIFTWIQIADATQLRTATYKPFPSKKTAKASVIARQEKAVIAMNGDWFMAEEKLKRGVVYRNGVCYREKDCGVYDALIIDNAGDFHIIRHAAAEEVKAYEGNIMHSFVFGPALVMDGELVNIDRSDSQDDWVIRHNEGWHGAQRSVLCQMGPLSYLIITTDGPEQTKGGGFSIAQIAQLAYDMGALQAYNMDGGSSAWLVLGGERINTRKTKNFRLVGDIVYFVTAEPEN